MIAGVRSHKNIGVIPLLFQITAFTFLQHMVTNCAVICQYNRHSWPERSLPLFLDLMTTLNNTGVLQCTSYLQGKRQKNKRGHKSLCTLGYILLVLDTFICVSNTDTSRGKMVALGRPKDHCKSVPLAYLGETFHSNTKDQHNNRFWCSRPLFVQYASSGSNLETSTGVTTGGAWTCIMWLFII